MNITTGSGEKIYNESIDIINSLLSKNVYFNNEYSDIEKNIVKRVIHASSDISYADSVFFTGNAALNTINFMKQKFALKEPVNLVCDSEMTKAGISKTINKEAILNSYSYIGMNENTLSEKWLDLKLKYDFLDKLGKNLNLTKITRSALSIRIAIIENFPDIIVIGNAPTALIEIINICKYLYKIIAYKPNLVVGMPVGFVGADAAKNTLRDDNFFSAIGNIGNLGGSPVAAAVINALVSESSLKY